MSERYAALALQTRCRTVNQLSEREQARARMMESIRRIGLQIQSSRAFIGAHVRLVVLPEYFLSGFPMQESAAEWIDKACLTPDGPEYEALGEIAQQNKIHLAGNVYERDEKFPGLFFQVGFIIDDGGSVILRYRRLISMYSPTPHDVLDRYLDIYGADSLFPVVDTPLGKLAALASEEILYPEISRALALKGAEALCHSTSESGAPGMTPKNIAKQARAFENHVYVVSANSGGYEDTVMPADSANGGSRLIDYEGRILEAAGAGESMLAHADLDIDALRHYRQRPGMFNLWCRQRLELFADVYRGAGLYPANNLLNEDGSVRIPQREHYRALQLQTLQNLRERGIL